MGSGTNFACKYSPRVNTCERIRCHAPLISYYSSISECLVACECDIALGRYRVALMHK